MESFGQKFLLIFSTALGVVMGASLLGSLAALLSGGAPIKIMTKLAYDIKIWAIVAALGGTFTTIEILQIGIFEGKFLAVIKQLLFLISAFLGAQIGYAIVSGLAGSR